MHQGETIPGGGGVDKRRPGTGCPGWGCGTFNRLDPPGQAPTLDFLGMRDWGGWGVVVQWPSQEPQGGGARDRSCAAL